MAYIYISCTRSLTIGWLYNSKHMVIFDSPEITAIICICLVYPYSKYQCFGSVDPLPRIVDSLTPYLT